MKYIPPLNGDLTDENRSYINADPPRGVQGSIPSAEALEHPIREILAVIKNAGLTLSSDNLSQLDEAINKNIAEAIAEKGFEEPIYETTLTVSGTWECPKTGLYYIELYGGGAGYADSDGNGVIKANGGRGGVYSRVLFINQFEQNMFKIGAGGIPRVAGGVTSFSFLRSDGGKLGVAGVNWRDTYIPAVHGVGGLISISYSMLKNYGLGGGYRNGSWQNGINGVICIKQLL